MILTPPHTNPKKAYAIRETGLANVARSSVTEKIGKKYANVLYPITEAISDGSKAYPSRSLLYKTSIPKRAPPSGALKMLPIPAPIPAATAIRRSGILNLKYCAIIDPKPAERSAAGPSLPPLPPVPIVIAEAIVFTMGRRHRTIPLLW